MTLADHRQLPVELAAYAAMFSEAFLMCTHQYLHEPTGQPLGQRLSRDMVQLDGGGTNVWATL